MRDERDERVEKTDKAKQSSQWSNFKLDGDEKREIDLTHFGRSDLWREKQWEEFSSFSILLLSASVRLVCFAARRDLNRVSCSQRFGTFRADSTGEWQICFCRPSNWQARWREVAWEAWISHMRLFLFAPFGCISQSSQASLRYHQDTQTTEKAKKRNSNGTNSIRRSSSSRWGWRWRNSYVRTSSLMENSAGLII